jgi:hypothetical protein
VGGAINAGGPFNQLFPSSTSVNNYSNFNVGGVASTTNFNGGILFYSNGGAQEYGIDLGYASSSSRYRTRIFSPSNADVSIASFNSASAPSSQSSFTDLLTIRGDSGNVGINNTAPVAKLTVDVNTVNGDGIRLANDSTAGYVTFEQMGTTAFGISSWVNATVFEAVPYSTGNFVLSAYTGNLLFQTNGRTTQMTITSAGNVGIGTTSPSQQLTLAGGNMLFDTTLTSTNYSEIRARYTGQNNCQSAVRFYNPNNGYGGAVTFWTQPEVNNASMVERMRIDPVGQAMLGTTTATATGAGSLTVGATTASNSTTSGALTVAGGVGITGALYTGGLIYSTSGYYFGSGSNCANYWIPTSGTSVYQINQTVGSSYLWYTSRSTTSDTQAMALSSKGALTVYNYDSGSSAISAVQGTAGSYAQSTYAINASGTYYIAGFYTTAFSLLGSITSNGTITSYNTTSDKRLKSPLRSWSLGDRFDQLPIGEFNWLKDGSVGHGTLAQDLYQIYPDAVVKGDDGAMPDPKKTGSTWSVDYGKLTVPLIAEVKTLRSRVKTLEQEQADTQKQLNDLTAKFNQYISTHP